MHVQPCKTHVNISKVKTVGYISISFQSFPQPFDSASSRSWDHRSFHIEPSPRGNRILTQGLHRHRFLVHFGVNFSPSKRRPFKLHSKQSVIWETAKQPNLQRFGSFGRFGYFSRWFCWCIQRRGRGCGHRRNWSRRTGAAPPGLDGLMRKGSPNFSRFRKH